MAEKLSPSLRYPLKESELRSWVESLCLEIECSYLFFSKNDLRPEAFLSVVYHWRGFDLNKNVPHLSFWGRAVEKADYDRIRSLMVKEGQSILRAWLGKLRDEMKDARSSWIVSDHRIDLVLSNGQLVADQPTVRRL